MNKWLDRHISVDWKTPGAEFLSLFTDSYPELTFLNEDAFEGLIDELANESPDGCFDAVAAHLAAHGYTLWNLDPDSDTYLLAIVPDARASKVVAQWCGPSGEMRAGSEPVRLGKAPASKRLAKGSAKRVRKPAPEIVEQTLSFDGSAPSVVSGGDVDLVRDWNDDGDGQISTLWNVAEWPPREVLAPDFLKEVEDDQIQFPLYGRSNEYWWYRRPIAGDKAEQASSEIVRIDSFDPYRLEVVHDTSHYPHWLEPKVQGCGRYVFLAVLDAAEGGRYRLKRYGGGPVATSVADIWFESSSDFEFLPLDSNNVVVYGEEHPPLWLSSGQDARPLDLRHDLGEATELFAISAHEFVYFTVVKRPNPEDGRFTEDRLQMNRVDVRTGRQCAALLEELVTDQHIDFVGEGKIRFRTFQGHLRICPGHGSWWILNFVSRQMGKKDHAWLWCSETGEVLRFGPDLFPRLEPRFAYLRSAGRYVVETTHKLRLLIDFDSLRQHLKPLKLHWSS